MSTIVETLNIGFVIPLIEMECELQLTLTEKGLLNSSAFIGQLARVWVEFHVGNDTKTSFTGVVSSSFVWGFLADWEKGGRKKIMHICSSVAFAFSVISTFSVHVWMLIVTRFFVGFL